MAVEKNVQARYAEGAREKQQALCCPVSYQTELLHILPEEIIERDYGCGDPSRYVREGDIVLDLGSGAGKICYMAAQLVGDKGHVYGVDMTDEMLLLARRYQHEMAEKIGQQRVSFHKGYIQNLAFDIEAAADFIQRNPISDEAGVAAYEEWKLAQQKENPMIGTNTISLVISNCVLNLVSRESRRQLFEEIYRVLKPGGRVAISDIICDQSVPQELQNDPELWSGCVSGAFEESEFLQAFVDVGFVNVTYDKWDEQAWRVVEGIEFRSATLLASKPLRGEASDTQKALMYRGPYQTVVDDFGNTFARGQRTLVSDACFQLQLNADNADDFVGFHLEKRESGAVASAVDMDAVKNDPPFCSVNRDRKRTQGGCC